MSQGYPYVNDSGILGHNIRYVNGHASDSHDYVNDCASDRHDYVNDLASEMHDYVKDLASDRHDYVNDLASERYDRDNRSRNSIAGLIATPPFQEEKEEKEGHDYVNVEDVGGKLTASVAYPD